MAALRRRWFSFSLRALFVLISLTALCVAWQLRIVRERRALFAEIMEKGGVFEWDAAQQDRILQGSSVTERWWQLMGDETPIEPCTIRIPCTAAAEIWHSTEKLFPNALVTILSKEEMEAREADRKRSPRID